MNAGTQKINVIKLLDIYAIRCRQTFNEARAKEVDEAIDAVAELILMMSEVLQLWDTDRMSIDAKAAALQDLPEKWRSALARFGDAA